MPVGNITQLTENKIADQNTISELRERCDALEQWVLLPKSRAYDYLLTILDGVLNMAAAMKLNPSPDEIIIAYRKYKEELCQSN